MNMQRYLLLAMAGLAVSLGGYGISARADVTAKEVGQNVTRAAESGANYAIQERDKYIRHAQREIDELRVGIDRLGVKARTARDEAKTKLDKVIATLDRKRDTAESRLDDVKSANTSAWKHLKAGMDSALEDLKQSFAKAGKEFD